jgi:hypothetical protein
MLQSKREQRPERAGNQRVGSIELSREMRRLVVLSWNLKLKPHRNVKEGRHPNGVNGYAHVQGNKPLPLPLKSVYITRASPFDAVEEFVSETRGIYNLDLFRRSPGGATYERGARDLPNPDVKAILVGTRRDDPHGSACSISDTTFFIAPTDRSFRTQANSTSKSKQTLAGLPFYAYTRY